MHDSKMPSGSGSPSAARLSEPASPSATTTPLPVTMRAFSVARRRSVVKTHKEAADGDYDDDNDDDDDDDDWYPRVEEE
eukprot:COSAG05_NODE_1331_length_5154_cov_14.769733_7_plen_79_part_00